MPNPFQLTLRRAGAAVAMLLLASGCGGSGGGGSAAPAAVAPPPPVASGPTWTPGVFQAASTFEDRCAVPRTGVDIEGNTFPDRSGTLLEELFWLRSWTNETYLWNTEVTDRNPATFSDRLAYFDVLKTTAKTPSGKDKDQFHFSQSTASYLAARNSAPTASYGAEFRVFASTPPRSVRVLYTEPNSPASAVAGGVAAFKRGTTILQVDGVDLVNRSTQAQVDALNNGLFPRTAGENHTFVVQDPGASTTRTVTLQSALLSEKPVNRSTTITTPIGTVGYVLLNTFSPFATEREIVDAIAGLKSDGVSDLVLDLRYNGGGLLAIASQLSTMVAGRSRTNGAIFERLQFNAAAGARNPVTGQTNAPTPFYDTGLGFSVANGTPLQTLDLPRVYVLSTSSTCSASESVVNGLRGIGVEVVLIGGTTCGKPFGFYPTDNCGVTYYTIQFQGVNNAGFGDYADGFAPANSSSTSAVKAPGCVVADDLDHELGQADEAMLAAALTYRATGSCPTATASARAAKAQPPTDGIAIEESDLTPLEAFLRNNRDMRMPNE